MVGTVDGEDKGDVCEAEGAGECVEGTVKEDKRTKKAV